MFFQRTELTTRIQFAANEHINSDLGSLNMRRFGITIFRIVLLLTQGINTFGCGIVVAHDYRHHVFGRESESERKIPAIVVMSALVGEAIVCVKYQRRIKHRDWRIVVSDTSVEQTPRRHLKNLKQLAVPVHV